MNKDDDVVIVISQSGETADTLAALRLAKSKVRAAHATRALFLYNVRACWLLACAMQLAAPSPERLTLVCTCTLVLKLVSLPPRRSPRK